MKKIISLFLVIVLCVSLIFTMVACNDTATDKGGDSIGGSNDGGTEDTDKPTGSGSDYDSDNAGEID
jgi:hypothetical protein